MNSRLEGFMDCAGRAVVDGFRVVWQPDADSSTQRGNMEPDNRPGRFGYFAAAALAIAGVVAPVLLVLNLLSKVDGGDQFIVPGSHAFVVQQPGKHLVWNDF